MIASLVALAALCLLLAALSDIRAFRIPNIYAALIILLFVATRALTGFSAADWGHALHFGIALAAGMLLFRLGWVGGGDAKLYAAAALWFAGIDAALLIFATGIAGFLLAVFYLLRRKFWSTGASRSERRIPYGVAIAGGALLLGISAGLDGLVPLA